MLNPLVSVIIPVYNVEKYLSQCLDSVINQTLKEIEIICVNDGSTDNSLKILEDYAKKDSRIRIINKENGGPGSCRNIGIDLSRGEYVAFVDSDDWIELNTYEETYKIAKRENVPLVSFNACRISEKGKKSDIIYYNSQTNKKTNWKEISDIIFESAFHSWHFIYKKDFLNNNNIRYPNLSLCEDVPFVLKSLLCAESIYFIPNLFYNYYIRTNSMCNKTTIKTLDILDIIGIVCNMLNNYNNEILNLNFKKWINIHLFRIIKRSGAEINSLFQNYLLHKSEPFIDKRDLNEFIFNNVYHTTKMYLFGFIPFIVRKDKTYGTKIKLFNITLFKIKRLQYSSKYYFLGILIYSTQRI